jgi:hypothetical protein
VKKNFGFRIVITPNFPASEPFVYLEGPENKEV